MRGVILLAVTFLLATAHPSPEARGGDWPQILGPHRNGHAGLERLSDAWPEAGPARRWEHEIGSGYAGPAIVSDRVLVFHRIGAEEWLECLGADSGQLVWSARWPARYRGGVDPDHGPRCVPLVHDGTVFVLGAAGDLRCVRLETGQELWSRQLADDYAADEGYFGVGSTPVLMADRLLVNVGGKSAGIIAVAPRDGRTLWQATNEGASYSSPTVYSPSGDKPLALFVTRLSVIAVDPLDGDVLFRFPFGRRGPTVNAATPIILDRDHVFLTASYGIGAVLLKITPAGPESIWSSDDSLSSQFPTPIHHDNYLIGVHGREDGPLAQLRCVEARTGRVRWRQPDFGMAHLILADDKLLALKSTGQLLLLEASARAYRELATARVSRHTTRALPALSDGRFCFRENQANRGLLVCLDLAPGNHAAPRSR